MKLALVRSPSLIGFNMISNEVVILTKKELKALEDTAFHQGFKRGEFEAVFKKEIEKYVTSVRPCYLGSIFLKIFVLQFHEEVKDLSGSCEFLIPVTFEIEQGKIAKSYIKANKEIEMGMTADRGKLDFSLDIKDKSK